MSNTLATVESPAIRIMPIIAATSDQDKQNPAAQDEPKAATQDNPETEEEKPAEEGTAFNSEEFEEQCQKVWKSLLEREG